MNRKLTGILVTGALALGGAAPALAQERFVDEYSLHPDARIAAPLAASDPFPYFDETRACQDRVRADFVRRNDDGDAYLEFTTVPLREDVGVNRGRIRGEAWARNRIESRPITYQCVLSERTSRVITAAYEVRQRNRYSSLY